jgi:hypothetical protein
MREWLPLKNEFLHSIIDRECNSSTQTCTYCNKAEGTWKCTDCFDSAIFCTHCIQITHTKLPFHRVKHWNGSFYQDAWLHMAGIQLFMGHGGDPCPSPRPSTSLAASSSANVLPPTVEVEEDCKESWEDECITDESINPLHKDVLTVVDISGIHILRVSWCTCTDSKANYNANTNINADVNAKTDEQYQQVLKTGLYPASFKRVKTVFTFRVLDDFLLHNLECKTPAMNYYSLLRRRTNFLSPKSVPDRYRELLRISRQWRHLNQLKDNGYGFGDSTPSIGDLATFCPTCPQPNINLPPNWEQSSKQYAL